MSRVVIEEDGRIERGDLEQKVFCRPCTLSPQIVSFIFCIMYCIVRFVGLAL